MIYATNFSASPIGDDFDVFDLGEVGQVWGEAPGGEGCPVVSGGYSAGAAQGGANGVPCGVGYDADIETVARFGPIDLSDAVQAEIAYQLLLDMDVSGDPANQWHWFGVGASLNGQSFTLERQHVNTDGFEDRVLDLTDFVVASGEPVLGESQVWIAFWVFGDGIGPGPGQQGAFIDEIEIRKLVGSSEPEIAVNPTVLTITQPGAQVWAPPAGSGAIDLDGPLGDHVPGRLIVGFESGVVVDGRSTGVAALDRLAAEVGVTELRPVFMTTPATRGAHAAAGLDRMYVVEFAGPRDVREVVRRYREAPGVSFAEPDMLMELHADPPAGGGVMNPPNDPLYPSQWGLRNTGQAIAYNGSIVGTPGSDLNVGPAWDVTTGNASVIIAILDTGVDLGHPEFAGRLTAGWDFFAGGPGGSPVDGDAHGTAAAGIAAAAGNNGQGVAGVSWNTRIMPVRVCGPGGCPWSATSSAITWAADQGAGVISMSLGGASQSTLMENAVNYAYGEGVVVLASTGNANTTVPNYPAAYANVISVGALSPCDTRKTTASCDGEFWWGSSYGAGMDFLAPGTRIHTTDIRGNAGYTSGDYVPNFNGTSAACPFAAGVAGLILSADPTLTPDEVRALMQSTAVDLGPPGYDIGTGYGRLNAGAALALLAGSGEGMFTITNVGSGVLDVTSMSVSQGWLSVDPQAPLALAAGQSVGVSLSVDWSQVVVESTATVTIGSNDASQPTVVVDVTVVPITPPPLAAFSPSLQEGVTATLAPGATGSRVLSILNEGGEPLEFSFPAFASGAGVYAPTVAEGGARVAEAWHGDRASGAAGGSPLAARGVAPAERDGPIAGSWHEGFESVAGLAAAGWALQNRSQPLGTTGWFQGNAGVFGAQSGPSDSYVGANFNATTGGSGVISNWLMTPEVVLVNGTTLSFWTRTSAGSGWPDRMEVRLSTSGSSTNVGSTAQSVGDFDVLLESINPDLVVGGYPDGWTQYTLVVSGVEGVVSGRFAFRYFVTQAGPDGVNSNYIGIDEVSVTQPAAGFVTGVSPASGAVAPGGAAEVTIGFSAGGYDVGSYSGVLEIVTNEPESYAYPVALVVEAPAPPQASVSPASLSFDLLAGEEDEGVVTLSNVAPAGSEALTFTASVEAAGAVRGGGAERQPGVTVAPLAGSVTAGGSQALTVSVEAGMEPGTHQFALILSTNDPEASTLTVPVTVAVGVACALTWSVDVTVDPAAGTSQLLGFGQGPDATDGIDAACGEAALPPPPPAFDARFILPDGSTGSYRDYRADQPEDASWHIALNATDTSLPVEFSWDASALPSHRGFYLRDVATGGLVVHVDMAAQESYALTQGGITALEIVAASGEVSVPVPLAAGWNILSVPVAAWDMAAGSLFPGATSSFFGFDGAYVIETELAVGVGYWARFDEAAEVEVAGLPASPREVAVSEGWNLIGFFETEVPVAGVVSAPAGIVASNFFGFDGTYQFAEVLAPGRGYWVNVTADGVLSFDPAARGAGDDAPVALGRIDEGEAGVLRVTDAAGRSAALYFVEDGSGEARFLLPPPPPAGAFDVRFASHRSAADLGVGSWEARLAGAAYPVRLSLENLPGALRLQDGVDGRLFDVELASGGEVALELPLASLRLTYQAAPAEAGVPGEFALGAAYPNPAGSVATIGFALPEGATVRVGVYDVLGRLVASVPEQEFGAGWHEVSLPVAGLASGTYVYRLEAGAHAASRRFTVAR